MNPQEFGFQNSYSFSSSIRFSLCFKTPFFDYENEHEDDDEYEKQSSLIQYPASWSIIGVAFLSK